MTIMNKLWVVLLVALIGARFGCGLPVSPTPQTYPQDVHNASGWDMQGGLYAALPALGLVLTAVGFLLGCTWCYRHKDCKLFTASATHLHDSRRTNPPDSGFSEPANNNISEDNNNGPISLREMQNIANNNATAYIVSENEERNRISRESVVEFEPLPTGLRVADPLERCADWFGGEDFPRNQLQYLREIGRGWFGRVVEGEIEDSGTTSTVAVKILNQNANLEDKARFLDEAKLYRDARHETVLGYIARCLQEDPWIVIFELCNTDLHQYLIANRPKMAILNESGVPLRLMCDVTSGLAYLNSRGYLYGNLWSSNILVRGDAENARAVLGRYSHTEPPYHHAAPETRTHPPLYTASSEVWSLGNLIWEVCAWGSTPACLPPALPDLPCPYRNHLYQVMQLCWNANPDARPTSSQVHGLVNHLYTTHTATGRTHDERTTCDFEDRWQRLKPNTIPKIDEHVAIVHAPSTSLASHFTSDLDDTNTAQDTLSIDMDTAVSRSSSIMSDKDPLSIQIKSESLTNLHGSLEDVRNIYLTHNEMAALECHQGNIQMEEATEKDNDKSDSSVDPWVKDIMAGSQDDVSYFKDVSDVIKNLDNILNSEKTSSSESSHQASPSRDNLSLDCKKEYPVQSSLVKSPGISNFQNILDAGFDAAQNETEDDDDGDRDTIGTLSHSFERHSDTISQQTLENLTPETPMKDLVESGFADVNITRNVDVEVHKEVAVDQLPNDKLAISDSEIPKLKELCASSLTSVSENVEQLSRSKDCQFVCDNNVNKEIEVKEETKSIDDNRSSEAIESLEKQIETSDSVEEVVLPDLQTNKNEPQNEEPSVLSEDLIAELSISFNKQHLEYSDLIQKVTDSLKEPCINGSDPKRLDVESNIEQFNNLEQIPLDEQPLKLKSTEECLISETQDNDNIDKIEDHTTQEETGDLNIPVLDKNECRVVKDDIPNTTKETNDDILGTGVHNVNTECKIQEATTEKQTNEYIKPEKQFETKEDYKSNQKICLHNELNEEGNIIVAKSSNATLEDNIKVTLDLIKAESNQIDSKSTDIENAKSTIVEDILNDVSSTATPTAAENAIHEVQNIENDPEENDKTEMKDLILESTLETDLTKEHTTPTNTVEKVDLTEEAMNIVLSSNDLCSNNTEEVLQNTEDITAPVESPVSVLQELESVQNSVIIESDKLQTPTNILNTDDNSSNEESFLPPEEVQNSDKKILKSELDEILVKNDATDTPRSDLVAYNLNEQSNDSTVYLDLGENSTNVLNRSPNKNKEIETIPSYIDSTIEDFSVEKNESTVYLDLPTATVAKGVIDFLHMERLNAGDSQTGLVSSTPLGSDNSADFADSTIKNTTNEEEIQNVLSETKIPDYGPGVTLTKLEQTFVPDSLSPFESPTKSHPTDTFDENSSVVLGPFENCSLELYKGVKSELVDLPKEELLAFSSNFSEMNLETPSPLRDVNFLNEVPDISHDEFYDITSASESKSKFEPIIEIEPKMSNSDPQTETNTDESGKSVTEKHVSPSTPPNSPGVFLGSMSHQKYLVNIDLDIPQEVSEPTTQNEIDLNQIELQITSKLAIAENENNMNIEYSGPLTVEGTINEDGRIQESILAGNGGSVEDLREELTLDEECVRALRNELELKLPLAQVAAIEPECSNECAAEEWSSALPAPPELVVSYPCPLSPIAEETGQQLCAYENDAHYTTSLITSSSESYPEPCSTLSPLPDTYTVHRDNHDTQDTRVTMSADSLNASPHKVAKNDVHTPIDDRTYNKNDEEKESNCERISQVSPFLVTTPTTDNSDNLDNATAVSTLSKTTLPTDAKLSKQPSECLSKATSIDSWCSNDTLYNVEENFDDLAMDPDLPAHFATEKDEGNSESTDTLTHNDDEKELSHCSTYIIHDSKSEACETFSPDSITANDNYTYTKVKTEATGASPSVVTKSELNDSTKNTQTKDLAYETLMSGIPTYSNCTTEVGSIEDPWKIQQPELVRRSPLVEDSGFTPPKLPEDKEIDNTPPQISSEPCVKKMESIEISCLDDKFTDSQNLSDTPNRDNLLTDIDDSPNVNYRNNMAPSITSTPLTEIAPDTDDIQPIPITLPDIKTVSPDYQISVPSFQNFQQSAEIRPQDLSSNNDRGYQDTEILLEGDSKTLSRLSNRDSLVVSERTPTYSDFENSAATKPHDINSRDKSSQSMESGISSEEFRQFENSVKSRPQDISSLIDASLLLLKSERILSSAVDSDSNHEELPSHSVNEPTQTTTTPPKLTNLTESHILVDVREPSSTYLINFDLEDEMEQPHSIIVTEAPLDMFKDSTNLTFDSHTEKTVDLNHSYDSHTNRHRNNIETSHLDFNGETKPEGPHSIIDYESMQKPHSSQLEKSNKKDIPNESLSSENVNGKSQNYATVNFLSETFEELIESNVDDNDGKDSKTDEDQSKIDEVSESTKPIDECSSEMKSFQSLEPSTEEVAKTNGSVEMNGKVTSETENFLQNEKKYCQLDTYFPLLSDIRFTGPASEIMSTSFTQDSPTSPTSPECEGDSKPDPAADIVKEWDSDTESQSSNSSSGEFIWKQRDGCPDVREGQDGGSDGGSDGRSDGGSDGGSGDSGSEGDEVEFVPSSWDCRAAPSKSSLRSLEQTQPDSKKRVVFKRQKYHCVYEYPREVCDIDTHSPAYLPDFSTYSEWDATSAEEAESGYGQLFGAPSPLDMYPLRSGISFGPDYDEDFFISSSARPFESLGIMSTTSQFFPGMHVKGGALETPADTPDTPAHVPAHTHAHTHAHTPDAPAHTLAPHTHTPSLDFTTPDSGVEDITPGSTAADDDFDKKAASPEPAWRLTDSESASPASPASPPELGGLRHTRDKLKLDLPPSPQVPSPRAMRVFNFVLDKPRRSPAAQPTFSTFGKSSLETEPEQKLILTDDVEQKEESPKAIEAVKGEGTVLDSGDEDSGIESSSKATLERQNKTNVLK